MITLHRSKNKQFYFKIKARNGKVLATSEMYTRKKSCSDGAAAVLVVLNIEGKGYKGIIDKTGSK